MRDALGTSVVFRAARSAHSAFVTLGRPRVDERAREALVMALGSGELVVYRRAGRVALMAWLVFVSAWLGFALYLGWVATDGGHRFFGLAVTITTVLPAVPVSVVAGGAVTQPEVLWSGRDFVVQFSLGAPRRMGLPAQVALTWRPTGFPGQVAVLIRGHLCSTSELESLLLVLEGGAAARFHAALREGTG